MGWGVDGEGTEFPTKPFDYEAARASMAADEVARTKLGEKPQAALCVHEWAREPEMVSVIREGSTFSEAEEEHTAFPCTKCGSLLVLQEREG